MKKNFLKKTLLFTTVSVFCYIIYFKWELYRENTHLRKYLIQTIKITNFSVENTLKHTLEPKIVSQRCHNSLKSNQPLLMLAVVIICVDCFEKRQLIRETWANTKYHSNFSYFFAVALSKNSTVNTQLLVQENLIYKDILQISSLNDSYSIYTIKVMKAVGWIVENCSNALFIFKVNDDVVVNTFYLFDYFQAISKMNYNKETIYGHKMYGFPQREKSNKFFIDMNKYGPYRYPPYPDGK
jgi:hypothetical protein